MIGSIACLEALLLRTATPIGRDFVEPTDEELSMLMVAADTDSLLVTVEESAIEEKTKVIHEPCVALSEMEMTPPS